ncbi:MAG: oxygen-independent coproporphyrinogen III oxidase-like protein [Candidatus Parcubacteria bacterium]|nr:oxygen-independent coproporphyrinogen III oxidase-like protein [Burkholderiales bacterium]
MSAVLRDARRVRFSALPPLSLYVHLPWCVKKCPYCDFNSHEQGRNAHGALGDLPFAEYVSALVRDLEAMLPSVWGRRLATVFIGGGTPSLFPAVQIDALLSAVRARMPLEPGAEITLEANPGASEAARFAGYRDAGVNRLSVGVQSFDDAMLKKLGRIHSADEARRAVGMAMDVFGNVNLDLMYGLPGQTLEMARADIAAGLSLGTPHLSAYQLTIEPNTVFFSQPPSLPEHDASADMQVMIEEMLGATGFGHYETSAFARPGRRCRHNLNYWEFGDYLGIGAGAHGKLSYADRVTRHERVKQPREYLAGSGSVAENLIEAKELPFEFMLNALRLVDGFAADLFPARCGLPLYLAEAGLREAAERGLLERNADRIRPTAKGRRFLNDLVGLFLPAQE